MVDQLIFSLPVSDCTYELLPRTPCKCQDPGLWAVADVADTLPKGMPLPSGEFLDRRVSCIMNVLGLCEYKSDRGSVSQ